MGGKASGLEKGSEIDDAEVYRALFGQDLDALLVLRGDAILSCNTAAASFLGYERDDLIGRPFSDVAPMWQADGELTTRKLDDIRSRVRLGSRLNTEWMVRCSDGLERLIEIRVGALPGGTDSAVLLRNLSEGKNTFRERLETEYFYRTLITKSPIAIALHRAGVLLYHNPAFAKLYGLPPDTDMAGVDYVGRFGAENTDEIRDMIRRRESGEMEETTINTYGLTVNGERFPAQIFGVRVVLSDGPASIVFIHDMRSHERAAAALQRSKADLETIIESTDDMIWSVEADSLNIIQFNKAFAAYIRRVYGIDLKPGMDLIALLPKERGEFFRDLGQQVREKGNVQAELVSLDGQFVFDLSLRGLADGGKLRSIVIFGKDVTATRRAEETERAMRERMYQAEKLTSLGLLVAGVAHEINNPNQYISANLGMLAEAWAAAQPILDEYREDNGDFLLSGLPYSHLRSQLPTLFNSVRDGSRRIHSIISELKAFAGGDNMGEVTPVELNRAVSAAIELCRGTVKRKTAHFRLRLGENLPKIAASQQRIEQVVINLVQNACDALADNSKAVEVNTGVTAQGHPFFSVADEGRGMSSDELAKIHTPFFTTRRESGGTGLGLFVSTNIVRSYGGELSFVSEPGKGTVATVVFRQELKT